MSKVSTSSFLSVRIIEAIFIRLNLRLSQKKATFLIHSETNCALDLVNFVQFVQCVVFLRYTYEHQFWKRNPPFIYKLAHGQNNLLVDLISIRFIPIFVNLIFLSFLCANAAPTKTNLSRNNLMIKNNLKRTTLF